MARRVSYGPLVAVAGLAIAGAALWHYRPRDPVPPADTPAALPAAPTTTAAVPDAAPPAVRFPIDDVQVPALDLPPPPPLDQSDAAFLDALSGALGTPAGDWLVREFVIPKLVATIDNVPRTRVMRNVYAAHALPGTLATAEADARLWLDEANYARYDGAVALFERVDLPRAVAVYRHFHPLFEQAYRDLGEPGRTFNDRLVDVVDHLLAAPDAGGPLELRRAADGSPRLQFVDPQLEGASIGHKAMWRMGPDHAARVKARLSALRALLAGQPPPA